MKKAWQKENADLGRPSWEALDLGEDKITKTQLALVLSLVVRSASTRRSHGSRWSRKSPKFKSASSRSNRIVGGFSTPKKTPREILSRKTLKPSLPEARQRWVSPAPEVLGHRRNCRIVRIEEKNREIEKMRNRRERERERDWGGWR